MGAEIDLAAAARYAWRRTPWMPVIAAGAVCASASVLRAMSVDTSVDVLPFVRLSSVVLAAAAVQGLDNPAEPVTATSPVGRWRVRAVAWLFDTFVAVGVWLPIVLLSRVIAGHPEQLPVPGLLIELLALVAVASLIAVALSAAGWGTSPSSRAASALVIATALTLTTPRSIRWLWVGPGSEWDRSHARWAVIGAASLVMFAVVSRDPSKRNPLRSHT